LFQFGDLVELLSSRAAGGVIIVIIMIRRRDDELARQTDRQTERDSDEEMTFH
jgi:hypothetical protein